MELENKLLQRVEQCYQLAEAYFKQSFARPTVSFKQRGKIAGSARLVSNELRFNITLYQENQSHFLEHTVAHEVSHLLSYILYGKVQSHGKHWQTIMCEVYKLPATRTHQYDVSSVQGKTFTYQCNCGEHQLSIRRHNKVQRGDEYRCKLCESTLRAV